MRNATAPATALVLALAFCVPCYGAEADSVEELIGQMADRLQAIETLRTEGETAYEFQADSTVYKGVEPFEMAYARPNRLRIHARTVDLVSDGEYVYDRSSFGDQYRKVPLDGALDETIQPMLSPRASLSPDALALLSGDPKAVLSDFVAKNAVVVLPDEKLDGRDCWVVDVTMRDSLMGISPTFRAWIDREFGLVRRWELDVDSALESLRKWEEAALPAELGPARPVEWSGRITRLHVNEPLAEEEFVFTPEEGEKEVPGLLFTWHPETGEEALSLDEWHFEQRWAASSIRTRGRPAIEPATFRLPPRHLALPTGKELVLIDPLTGREQRRLPVPAPARRENEMGEVPRYVVLSTPHGPVVVAVQRFYDVKETGPASKSYHPRQEVLTAFDAGGNVLWSRPLMDLHTQEAGAVASGNGSDLLLLVSHSEFHLYDAAGVRKVKQHFGYGNQLLVADVDGDGAAEFYVVGRSASCYTLRDIGGPAGGVD